MGVLVVNMTEKQAQIKVRFKQVVKHLNLDRHVLAGQLGYKKRYLDQILSADKNLSETVLLKFTKRYKKVNEDWLLRGEGEMLHEQMVNNYQIEDDAGFVAEPEMEHVEKLREAVLERYKPDPPLSLKQDLTLRQACLKVMTENKGQPWTALVVGAGVYLRFIEAYPNLGIPEVGSPGVRA